MSTPTGSERQPRRGDVVQAAPFTTNGVSGTVVGVTQGRMSLDSPAHGRLQLPLARFTWKPKARVWICWPAELAKHMKVLEACVETHRRARYGLTPCVGDCVNVGGKIGWIARKSAKRTPTSPLVLIAGAMFEAQIVYEISLLGGNITLESDRVAFDNVSRVWCATRG